MKNFDQLLEISKQLLGPQGCPWDREQTLYTLQPYLLEETHELIEAIDKHDGPHIAEELGDVFYALIFIGQLAEQQGLFSLSEALEQVGQKLIRRHPHVFGNVKADTLAEIEKNWDAIKKEEKSHRKSVFEGIPPSLPALVRAQKIAKKVRKMGWQAPDLTIQDEEEAGKRLWELICSIEKQGIDAESALRRMLQNIEKRAGEVSTA